MSVPFHKQTDPAKMAGQHRYGFDREPYLKHSNAAPDVTLSDYIARKQEGEKKLTFDEWIAEHEDASAESIWYAALRYGKIS